VNEEILKNRGRLVEAELDARRNEIAVKGLVQSLRGLLDPFEPTADLKDERILDQTLRLCNLVIGLRGRLAHIAELKKALGRL
jgi:hypothetical protein